jgi:pyridoxine 5-phosphate synthase
VSVFVDPEEASVHAAAIAGAGSVELNCRAYVEHFGTSAARDALARLAEAGELARSLGLRVHAAHDLGSRHLPDLVHALRPDQVSVGHNFVADAVLAGMCSVLPTFLRAVGSLDH